jgi:hypothetical protein
MATHNPQPSYLTSPGSVPLCDLPDEIGEALTLGE